MPDLRFPSHTAKEVFLSDMTEADEDFEEKGDIVWIPSLEDRIYLIMDDNEGWVDGE